MEDPKERNERLRSRLRVAAVFAVLALVVAFLIYFSLVALGRAPLPRRQERPAATAEPLPTATEESAASPTPGVSPRTARTPAPAAETDVPTATAVPTATVSAAPASTVAAVPTAAPTATIAPTPTATAEPTPTEAPPPAAITEPSPTATMEPTPTTAAAPAAAAPTAESTSTAMPESTPALLAERGKSLILPVDLQSIGLTDWRLQIANYDLRLSEDYAPEELVMVENWQYVDLRIEGPLREMFRAARDAGYSLYFCSGFRDYDTQASIYWRNVNNYMYSGYSFEEADALTRRSVNVPGASEHQLGLTADILEYAGQDMLSYIGGSGLMAWLEKNCTKYGFIIRYPEGKEAVTGVDYEPWHLRYVGTAAAEYITRNGLCLEEFLPLYAQRKLEAAQTPAVTAEVQAAAGSGKGKGQS